MKHTLFLLIAGYVFCILYYRYKPAPKNISGKKRIYKVSDKKISFIYDLSWYEKGKKSMNAERNIFKKIHKNVKNAKKVILFDIFLFNNQKADYAKNIKSTSIIVKDFASKKYVPRFFITDPINTSYNTDHCKPLDDLQKDGTKVIFTDLEKLPDNNLLYSGFWRLFFQWFGTSKIMFIPKFIPNPQTEKKTTIRAFLKAMNGKANHRKVIITDNKVIVTSSNLHDASSNYCNSGLEVEDARVANHFIQAEKAVAEMSGISINPPLLNIKDKAKNIKNCLVTPLMDGQIKDEILKDIEQSNQNDKIFIGMLFIAHRQIVNSLKKAAKRKVKILIILDKNKTSFDHKKIGLPNNYLIPELIKSGIETRFFNDNDNEFHAKFIYIKKKNRVLIHAGSANLTRRSLLGSNLENNIRVEAPIHSKPAKEMEEFIKRLKKPVFSSKVTKKPDSYLLRYLWLRFAERIGLATW